MARDMKEKLLRRNNEFRAAQEEARRTEEWLKKDAADLRQRLATIQEATALKVQEVQATAADQKTRLERELAALRDHNNKLLNDLDAALRSVPETLRIDSEKIREAESSAAAVRSAKEKELQEVLRKAAADKERALELQKKQYEFWLDKRTGELKKYVGEFEAYKAEKTRQMVELEGQAFYLLDYANALASLLANFERGLYPVYEKAGVKAVLIPDREKPGPMRPETLRDIAKYKKRAEDFARAHPGGLAVAFTEDNPAASPDAAAASPQAPADADAAGPSSARPATEAAGAVGEAEWRAAQADLATLRTKLAAAEALNASSLARVRAELEREMLEELSGRPAVEHLRRAEDERAHYQAQLAEEVRRTRDLRVAMDAKQRMLDRANAALAAARLPTVGLGGGGSLGSSSLGGASSAVTGLPHIAAPARHRQPGF